MRLRRAPRDSLFQSACRIHMMTPFALNMVSGDPSHLSDALVAVVRRKVETRLF